MTEPTLVKNMVLEVTLDTGTRVMRVLCFEQSVLATPRVALIDIADPAAYPRWWETTELELMMQNGDIRVCSDPFADLLARVDEELSAGERATRERRYVLIEDLVIHFHEEVLYEEFRGRRLAQIAGEKAVDLKTVRTALRLWWQRGQSPNALLSNHSQCGGPGRDRVGTAKPHGPKRGAPRKPVAGKEHVKGINIDFRTQRLCVLGGRRFYEKEGRSIENAYWETLRTYFPIGHSATRDGTLLPIIPPEDDRVTLRQFMYHYESHKDVEKALKKRGGTKRFNLLHRPVLGTSAHLARGPMALLQVDATIADITLISSLRPDRTIDRPVIFMVMDVFTRMIVGFSVSLEGPNWRGLASALECAFGDKVKFCRSLGREIAPEEWPCAHLADAIIGDRGPAELLSQNSDFLFNVFAIRGDTTPPCRPDWKAVVERIFRTINDRGIHWEPGAVHGPRGRQERDPRLDAVHTLRSFTRLLLEIVLHYNNHHWLGGYEPDADLTRDQVPLIPVELWKWGVANRAGSLRHADPEIVRQALLRRVEATVTPQGLFAPGLGIHYTAATAVQESWFIRQPGRRRARVELGIHDHDVSEAYLRLDNGQAWEPCTLLPKYERFRGKARDEVLDERALERREKRNARVSSGQDTADFLTRVNRITEEATRARDEHIADSGSHTRIGSREDRKEERNTTRMQSRRNAEHSVEGTPNVGLSGGEAENVPAASELDILLSLQDQ